MQLCFLSLSFLILFPKIQHLLYFLSEYNPLYDVHIWWVRPTALSSLDTHKTSLLQLHLASSLGTTSYKAEDPSSNIHIKITLWEIC